MKRCGSFLLVFLFLAFSAFAEPVSVSFWHAMTGTNGDVLKAIVDKYNASQNEGRIELSYKGSYSDTMDAGIAAYRAGTAPAILQVYEVGTATMMAAKGAVKPVYQLMPEYNEKFDSNAYIPAIKSYYSTGKGEMISMPFNVSTPVMYYNKDAFKKAGLDPEKPPVTWEEFFETAKKLKASGMAGGFSTEWISWIQIENFSTWHNVPVGTEANGFNGLDTKLVFNTPLQARHLTNIYNLSKSGVFIYGGREGNAGSVFMGGQTGLHFASIGVYTYFRNSVKFPLGVARLPYYSDVKDAPQNSIIGGASLWVLNGRPKAEYKVVADFLSFLSRPEIQVYWHKNTGYLPITTAAYEMTKADGYYVNNPGLEIAIKQLQNKAPTANSAGVRFGNFNAIRSIEDQVWEDILADKISVKDGLDKMVQDGNLKLRDFERLNK